MGLIGLRMKLFEIYSKVVMLFILLIFLGTFSLGRAFSVIDMFELFGVPFYVTDVFIVFALPLAVKGVLDLKTLPALFRWPFWAFLAFGTAYILWGLLIDRNIYAVRGVVLSVYLLFLPIVWVLFKQSLKIDLLLALIIVSNIFSVMLGLGIGPQTWLMETRGFNLTLFYGITAAFLVPYGLYSMRGKARYCAWVLAGINIYMVLFCSVRSAWVAAVCLMVFLLLVFYSRWKEVLLAYAIILLCVFVACGSSGSSNGTVTGPVVTPALSQATLTISSRENAVSASAAP